MRSKVVVQVPVTWNVVKNLRLLDAGLLSCYDRPAARPIWITLDRMDYVP
jgi:hypothetical protein